MFSRKIWISSIIVIVRKVILFHNSEADRTFIQLSLTQCCMGLWVGEAFYSIGHYSKISKVKVSLSVR